MANGVSASARAVGSDATLTVGDVMEQGRGVAPGFHFLRHLLSVTILLFHAYVLTFGGNGNAGYAKGAISSGLTMKQMFIELLRPGLFSLVGTFFALSGFLVVGSALRSRSLRVFFTLRILRILPALFTEVTLSALVLGPLVTTVALGAYFSDPQFFRYFGNIVGDITFELPGVFVDSPWKPVVNASLWTLPAEFYCYLVMALVMATGLVYRRALFTVVTLGLTLGAAVLVALHWDGLAASRDTTRFEIWFLVILFLLGALGNMHAKRIPVSFPLFLACGLGYFALMLLHLSDVLAGVLLVYCMLYVGMQRFTWFDRLLKDDLSYGIYLYGFPLTQGVIFVFGRYLAPLPGPLRLLVVGGLSLAVTVIFATLSWRMIERRALKLKSVFLPARKPVGAPAAAE